ncbi:MAG: SGNH/GDSL hydrolase family protein [Terrimonas sp.]|nr:SGNH/GDSL hydrolase family protein [Terrimonas sp.]
MYTLSKTIFNLLALGDSYTIGESLVLTDSFPYQVVQHLRQKGIAANAPEMIAKTGWTTDELQRAMQEHTFLPAYDFVTLLIGVNNQYRGRSVHNYQTEFELLLQQAVQLTGGDPGHLVILSIPDWGVTPFAAGKDLQKISLEIDAFNDVNRNLALQYQCHYIDITAGSREALHQPSLIAADGLHPAATEYQRWAKKISELIFSNLQG